MTTIDIEQTIRERAYQIWDHEGRLHGRADAHWHAAKLELARELAAVAVNRADAPAAEAPQAAPKAAVKKSRRAAPVEPQAPVVAAATVAATRRRRAPAKSA